MRITGNDCLLLFACLSCIATVASHILGRDRNVNHRWMKREVQCEDSQLVTHITRSKTYLSIITDNGNKLFSVDDRNTTWEEVDDILSGTAYLIFKIPNIRPSEKSPNFHIFKRPTESGLSVNILNDYNETLFRKEFQGSQDIIKNLNVKCAHMTGFKVILEDSLDINHRNGYNITLLQWATIFGDEELVKKLVERGANVNAAFNGLTPLSTATAIGKDSLVEYLIKHGANVNEPSNSGGITPLHIACLLGRMKSLQVLLDNGANISARSGSDGFQPLIYAIAEGQNEVVKVLIARGDVNQNFNKGLGSRTLFTPLYAAILFENDDIIPYLIKSGADVNTKFEGNYTPLMCAVSQRAWNEERTLEVVKLLVDHNADVNAKTKNGETALRIAIERDLTEVPNYLKARGAK